MMDFVSEGRDEEGAACRAGLRREREVVRMRFLDAGQLWGDQVSLLFLYTCS